MPEQTERAAEDRALEAAADEIQAMIFAEPEWKKTPSIAELVAIMRRHELRGPEPHVDLSTPRAERKHPECTARMCGLNPCRGGDWPCYSTVDRLRAHTTTEGEP